MDIRPHNPKLLLLDGDGKPVPFAHILFYEEGTDVPASVFVEDTEAETNFVIADDSGFFPSVILHPRKYTLRSFVPMECVENPSFPADFVAYESWNLDGGDAPDADETEVAFVASVSALRDVDTSAYSAADVNGVRYALYPNTFSFPDDGGFAIVPNDASGKIWIARIYGGRLPVTLFGADSSGQASSSSAIAAAFSCVAYFAQTPRSPVPMPTAVYFPYGNYKIEEDVSATAPVVFAEFARITNATDYSLDFHIYDKYTFEGGNDYVFAGNPVVLKYHLSVPHFVDGRLDGGVGAVDAANVGDYAEVFASTISATGLTDARIARAVAVWGTLSITKSATASLYIGEFDLNGGTLDLDGVTGLVEVGCEIRSSQLASAARDLHKIKGPRLVVDTPVSLLANTSLSFEEVFVATYRGILNETAAPFSFSTSGAVSGVDGGIAAAGVLVGNRVRPRLLDWTGCGSAEFSAFVVAHGGAVDFEDVSISANLVLSGSAFLRNLNLTGDIASSAILILSGCVVSGKVASKSLRIDGSNVGGVQNACDCEVVGGRIGGNVSLVNDGTSDPITLRLNRCSFSGYIVFNTASPIQDIVVRECNVAHACFTARIVGEVVTPTYSPIVYSWAAGARVNIDISDNTTTDNGSDPLLRSKGIITMDGAEQVSGAYVTKISAKGFIDFLKPNGTDSRILDGIFGGKAICSYDASSGVSMFTAPQYTTDASGAAAIRRRASGTALAFADPWNTQTNW